MSIPRFRLCAIRTNPMESTSNTAVASGYTAHARWIARYADKIAHTERVGGQKFGLNAENVAIAAAEVIHRFDMSVLLNQLASRL